jgi:nicotinamide mononucleotide transporter
MVATFAMARGWTDFWLCWIAVDLVGVPLLWHSHYYATSVMYVAYAGLVVWGFVVWLRAGRAERDIPVVERDIPVVERSRDPLSREGERA